MKSHAYNEMLPQTAAILQLWNKNPLYTAPQILKLVSFLFK
jgi:hypothetical protein